MSQELKFQLWGWILFVVCAVLFIASSLRNGDILALVASVLFLVGCAVFIVPLLRAMKAEETDETAE